ncbi:MAG: patatin-like phospholipase family protein [Ramlibacter sp.]
MIPASTPPQRTINLALQGGGSHGAFTWGVLDALLADPRIAIEGISGASAGAVNAVALADGYARAQAAGTDPRQAARESLARVWGEVSALGHIGALQKGVASLLWGAIPKELAPTNFFASAMQGWFSPYQSNPLDINPLRELLTRLIDFKALGALQSPRVFVSATHVNTGKAALFTGADVTPQAVMASACLPMLFQAVEIDGQHYWDGGYSVNPALTPLIDHCASADIVLVQINPLRREDTPRTPADILDRVNELTFNASLLTQVRSIDFINRLLAEGSLRGSRCRRVLLHRIDGGEAIQHYPASSRASADPDLIQALFKLGQTSGQEWLQKHFMALGQRSTVDIGQDYLDDTRLDSLPRPHHGQPPPPRRGLKSLISRLFGRRA